MKILEYFILQWANLAILLIGLIVVIRRPAREFLQGRREKFRLSAEKAKHDLDEAQIKYDEAKKKESGAARDARNLKQSMIETGKFSRQKIIDDAVNTSERIRREAKLMASYELQSAKDALTKRCLLLALSKAHEILQGGISKENHEKLLIESFSVLKQTDFSQYESASPTT